MLRAILHGKAGRVQVNDLSVSWKHLFKSREDLLTAAILSRWSYLSTLAKNTLMQEWLGDCEIDFTEFTGIEFWPRFDLDREGSSFVEPDALIRFKNFNVLVEVKPPSGGNQYFGQWEKEIEGYFYSDESLPLHFLAIGRNTVNSHLWKTRLLDNEKYKPESICTINWKKVAKSIFSSYKQEEPTTQDHRIYLDMLEALKIYGVRTHHYKWSDFNKNKNDFMNIDLSSLSIFGENELKDSEVDKNGKECSFKDLLTSGADVNLEEIIKWKT